MKTISFQLFPINFNLNFCFLQSDGAGRSGTFIAISILMEQLKLEHSIDVFQTIKKIRATRPEFVQTEVFYFNFNILRFCHDVQCVWNKTEYLKDLLIQKIVFHVR